MSRSHKAWWLNTKWVVYALCIMLAGCFSPERDSQRAEKLFYEKKSQLLEIKALLLAHPGLYKVREGTSYQDSVKYGDLNAEDEKAYNDLQKISSSLGIEQVVAYRNWRNKGNKLVLISYVTDTYGLSVSGYMVSIECILDKSIVDDMKRIVTSFRALNEDNWYISIME